MGLFSGLGDIISSVVNIAVTAFTGNPLFGQIAGSLVSSLLNDSGGGSGDSGFNDVFNKFFGDAFLKALGS